MRALLLLPFAWLAACTSAPSGSCSTDTECPSGQRCAASRCVASDTDAAADSTLDGALDGSRDGAPSDTAPRPDAPPADVPLVGFGCSGDLRTVLDNDGTPLGDCPSDQGCLEGRCVEACAAAAGSHGTRGCEFLASTPPTYPVDLQPCHAVFVTNSWSRPVNLTVTRAGATLDVSRFARVVDNAVAPALWQPLPATGLPPNGVAVLFLSSDPNSVMTETGTRLTCPITPAVNAATTTAGSGRSDAFRLRADAPVSAYSIMPFGGAPSFFPGATILLPTSVLGTGYVTIGPPAGTTATPGPQWLQVVAQADNTLVTVRPTVNLPAGGMLPAIAAGASGTVTLGAGQYAHWELPAGRADPSATVVVADHPVAVNVGNRFLRLQPTEGPGGEGTHTQQLPLSALGISYTAAPYPTRRADLLPEVVPYRLVGAVDGTTLSYDPPVPGAPTTLARGAVVDFSTALAFTVSSQDAMHPFGAAQLMPTANLPVASRPGLTYHDLDARVPPRLGDEEFTQLFPPAQFLNSYVFFTDPSYGTTSLVVVRERAASGFAPVTVDCLGVLSGFTPVGTAGRYEFVQVDLVRAGIAMGTCANGRHTAASTANFGITVWGVDTYASYAYPAGGNARQLTMVTPPG